MAFAIVVVSSEPRCGQMVKSLQLQNEDARVVAWGRRLRTRFRSLTTSLYCQQQSLRFSNACFVKGEIYWKMGETLYQGA